jgi:phosphoribosyl 1,2-cyclic phosphodiesterase
VVQRIRPSDLETPTAREFFLSQLPPWLFGSAGGNTSCIEVTLRPRSVILLDGGSGLREFATTLKNRTPGIEHFHMFFSHFHWDHLQGIPFFPAISNPKVTIDFYSPEDRLEEKLQGQMRAPYFPVTLSNIAFAKIGFHEIKTGPIKMDGGEVAWKRMNHPGGCYSYRISDGKKSVVYATDSELTEKDFEKSEENIRFFQNVDALIMDSQYTLGEAVEKFNWGHSSFSLAVDFASEWNIKNLYLFHHEPLYNDKKLYNNLQSARWYYSHLGKTGMNIFLAEEGREIEF